MWRIHTFRSQLNIFFLFLHYKRKKWTRYSSSNFLSVTDLHYCSHLANVHNTWVTLRLCFLKYYTLTKSESFLRWWLLTSGALAIKNMNWTSSSKPLHMFFVWVWIFFSLIILQCVNLKAGNYLWVTFTQFLRTLFFGGSDISPHLHSIGLGFSRFREAPCA